MIYLFPVEIKLKTDKQKIYLIYFWKKKFLTEKKMKKIILENTGKKGQLWCSD